MRKKFFCFFPITSGNRLDGGIRRNIRFVYTRCIIHTYICTDGRTECWMGWSKSQTVKYSSPFDPSISVFLRSASSQVWLFLRKVPLQSTFSVLIAHTCLYSRDSFCAHLQNIVAHKTRVILTVSALISPEVVRDLLDVDVEGQSALIRVLVSELSVQHHFTIVIADWRRKKRKIWCLR